MSTAYIQWCSWGTWFYHHKNLYFGKPNAKYFLTQLENAIDSNSPTSNIEIPCEKFKIDHCDFEKQYHNNELKEIGDIYSRILNKLEKQKFIMKKERKIEIFNIWIYWVAGSNYEFVGCLNVQLFTEFYSMKKTLEVVRSVLYEEQNLSCCFNFKRTNLDPNHLTRLDSLYDDMMIQGDLLSRAICSQSLQNVKLIIENGYVIENNESTILKSPLHWAFYCNNKLIFHYFIELGYKIKDDDIFYDPTHKKDFQFSVYLHFLKNKAEFKNIPIYKQLKFDHVGFMLQFKLYKKYGEDQIFDLYESMFRLGFDLSIKKNILNKNDCFYAGVEQNGIEFTQLICCLCQNGITKSIIKYLVNKYLHEYGYEKTQVELIKIIKLSIYYFFYYLTDSPSPRLTSTDLIILLDTLFDLLDENSLKHLRRIFRNNLDELFHNLVRGFIEKYEGKATIQIEYHLDYLYDRKYFRIFDYLVKYKLFNYRDVTNRFSYLTFL